MYLCFFGIEAKNKKQKQNKNKQTNKREKKQIKTNRGQHKLKNNPKR